MKKIGLVGGTGPESTIMPYNEGYVRNRSNHFRVYRAAAVVK